MIEGTTVAYPSVNNSTRPRRATRRFDMLKHLKYWLLLAPLMMAPLIPGCQILGE